MGVGVGGVVGGGVGDVIEEDVVDEALMGVMWYIVEDDRADVQRRCCGLFFKSL